VYLIASKDILRGVSAQLLRGVVLRPLLLGLAALTRAWSGYSNQARLRGLFTCIIDAPGYQLLVTAPTGASSFS